MNYLKKNLFLTGEKCYVNFRYFFPRSLRQCRCVGREVSGSGNRVEPAVIDHAHRCDIRGRSLQVERQQRRTDCDKYKPITQH